MNVLKELWKNKPMLITIVIGAAVLLYILIKNNSATVVAPAAAPGPAPAVGGGGTFVEESYYNNSPTTTNITSPVASAPTTAPPGNIFPSPVVMGPPIKVPAPAPVKPAVNNGLLGKGVRMFPQTDGSMKYRGPTTGGKIIPVPLPKGTIYSPGGSGRYWYRLPGSAQTQLLTSG